MKKILFALAAVAAFAFALHADEERYVHPGWKCADTAAVAHATELARAAGNTWAVCECGMAMAYAEGRLTSWQAVLDAAEDVAGGALPKNVPDFAKQYALRSELFLDDAIAYVVAGTRPSLYDINYFMELPLDRLGLTPAQAYAKLLASLRAFIGSPAQAAAAVARLNFLAVQAGIDEAVQAADFRRLNRIYSAQLARQGASWEPPVVAIRTILETF